jgi:hypothetical protein
MISKRKLEEALRHVMDGRRIVSQQRQLIAEQKAAGYDTLFAEQILNQFERTLAIFEDDLRELQNIKTDQRLLSSFRIIRQ